MTSRLRNFLLLWLKDEYQVFPSVSIETENEILSFLTILMCHFVINVTSSLLQHLR